ncbi:MAG: NUDIX domain-containing protein [Aeromicrobium sp.]|uniref:NUDIX hydrolase n=1 Tax=Aeromicrobium sp. TaxID=1871063 RepID=UPI0039E21418
MTRQPRRTQRLGAYAVALREGAQGRELLLTRMSSRGYPAGYWALPGGGVQQGESPEAAMLREVYEETGLTVAEHRLVAVHDLHTVATGRGGVWEDYHGVHILYACRVDTVTPPRVVEQDGSSDLAAWIPVADLPGGRPLLQVVGYVLGRLDDFA